MAVTMVSVGCCQFHGNNSTRGNSCGLYKCGIFLHPPEMLRAVFLTLSCRALVPVLGVGHLGACILQAVQQSAPGIPKEHLEDHQLEGCGRASACCQGLSLFSLTKIPTELRKKCPHCDAIKALHMPESFFRSVDWGSLSYSLDITGARFVPVNLVCVRILYLYCRNLHCRKSGLGRMIMHASLMFVFYWLACMWHFYEIHVHFCCS